MRKVTERSKHQLEKELRALVSQRVWQFKDQAIIAMYLHNLPYNLFAEGERHFHEAYKMAYKLDEEIKERNPDSPQKNHHKNVLLAVRDMWKVFYSPTGKTPRMFGTDLTFLKSTIRHVLFPHWIDFDLKNCQLSIVAGLYHVPKTQEFLKTGASIWKELTVYMGIAEDRRATAKEFLKQALYSIVYGMTMTEAERSLQDDLGCRGIWWNNDFTSHPIIREVARAIRRAIKDIREQGGMKSAYGWMALEEGEKEETVLANAIQSYELSIVAACYKLVPCG